MATKLPVKAAAKARDEYIFKPFNDATLAATRTAWLDDAANGDGFGPDVEQLMDWVDGHIDVTQNEIAYGVFKREEKVAIGICELAVTKPSVRGKWVKMIRLRLRPQLDAALFTNDPVALSTAVKAYTSSVVGVYHVKNVHGATIIKVYGRTQEQMRFLNFMVAYLKDRPDATFKAELQGRWLVINWGNK